MWENNIKMYFNMNMMLACVLVLTILGKSSFQGSFEYDSEISCTVKGVDHLSNY
jgi:hypothetical protein